MRPLQGVPSSDGPPLPPKRIERLSRRALAALARLRLQGAFHRAAGLSPQAIEAEAEATVKDLLWIGAIAYPDGPAQVLGAVTRLLLVRVLNGERPSTHNHSRGGHMTRPMLHLTLALAFLLTTVSWAEATTYWVGKSGSDSNSCATASGASDPGASNRKLTITAGVNCLLSGAGDTLIIGNGTYDESLGPFEAAQIPSGASDSVRTIVQAENNNQAILRPSVVANCDALGGVIVIQNRSHITMTGLYLDANVLCPNGLVIATRNVSDVTQNITFQNGTIEDGKGTAGGTGLVWAGRWDNTVTNKPANISILNSTIRRMDVAEAGGFNHCLYFKPVSGLVEGNTVSNCFYAGVTTHDTTGGANASITVRKNRISDCGSAGIRLSGDGKVAENNIVERAGNVAEAHAAISIHLGTPSDNRVDNNTVIDSVHAGIGIYSGGSGNFVRNNIVYGGAATIDDSSTGTTLQANRCDSGCPFSADPVFTNAASGDFTLQNTSPMIDVGTDLSALFTTDYNGTTRPGTGTLAWDVGAFEFVTPPNPDPPARPAGTRGRLR